MEPHDAVAESRRRRAGRPRPGLGGGPGPAQSKTTTWRRPSPARSRSKAASRSSSADAPVDQPLDRQPAGKVERGVAREVDRPDRRTRSSSRGSAGCRRRTGRPRTTPARSTGVIPTSTAVPPSGRISMASSTVAGRPIASNTKSGPPSVRSRRASIGGGAVIGRQQAVGRAEGRAPRPAWPRPGRSPRSARPRRATAPITHDSPTPPSPMTATLAPAGTWAVFRTAPDPGRDAAADQRRDRRIDAVREGDGGRFRDDRRLGHRADPAIGQDGAATLVGQDRGTVGHRVAERRGVRAGPWMARHAGPTHPARDQPRQRDRLPDGQRADAGPECLDDAGALVAHRDRGRTRPVAIPDVEVGVADARREDTDPDLPGTRLGQRQVLDGGRLAEGPQHRRPSGRHVSPNRRRSVGRAGRYGT